MNSYRVTIRDRTTEFDIVHTVHLADDETQAKRRALASLSKSLQVAIENFDVRKVVQI